MRARLTIAAAGVAAAALVGGWTSPDRARADEHPPWHPPGYCVWHPRLPECHMTAVQRGKVRPGVPTPIPFK
jgi:hypothetical protein